MEIRTATFSDSQPIADLLVASLVSESQWQYLFPDRHAHATAHASRIQSVVANCLNSPNDWTVTVAEDPNSKSLHSVAIWSTTASVPSPGAAAEPATSYTD